MLWKKQPVGSKIADLTSKFKVTDLGSFASESALATGLSTKIGTMANREVAFIQFQMSTATTNFGAFAYVGTLTRVAATYASFSVSVTTSGNASHTVVGSMNNGTWKMEQVALSSKLFSSPGDTTDFNSMTTTGLYVFGYNASGTSTYHRPENSAGVLMVNRINGSAFQQTYTVYAVPSVTYSRVYSSNAWTAWEQYALNSKIANVVNVGQFNASGSGVQEKITGSIAKVTTGGVTVNFTANPSASGVAYVSGYLYPNKDYGGGYYIDTYREAYWYLSNGSLQIIDLNSRLRETFSYTTNNHTLNGEVVRYGKVVTFTFFCDVNITDNTEIATLPSGFRPSVGVYPSIYYIHSTVNDKTYISIANDGKVKFRNPDGASVWATYQGTFITE